MRHNIGVTGTGSLIGQAIIKSIQKSEFAKKYKIIGFDYLKNTVGSFWCEKHINITDIYLFPHLEDDWLEEIVCHVKKERLDVLFVGVDFELELFARHKEFIEKHTKCKVIISSPKTIEIGNDKYLTYKFLKSHDLFCPATYLPDEVEFDKLSYPVIVKPRVGARSRGVFKIEKKADLIDKLKILKNPIIQEHIGNKNKEYTCGVICLDGNLKASIALKRSLKEGNTYISEHDIPTKKIILDYIADIADKLNPYGSCNLQLRIDDSGIPKLFEINPRHSGTTYIRSLFGFNEIIYIIHYLLEKKEMNMNLRSGKVIRYFEEVRIK